MTSLSKQLEALRTATAQQLTVEKKHTSLLFDRKEAQKLDRETVFKIGCTGRDQLKKLDSVFDADLDFFKDTSLAFQRILITKEENDSLNKKIDKLLYQMSPYLQHFACQQVLEWLIFQYQIHAFNAETLIMVFLPYHETNVYGRLLSILEFNFSISKDWAFMERFARKELPVPFKEVVKAALSSNHSLVTKVANHLEMGLQVVGDVFIENRASLLFAFHAKLLLALLEDAQKVDEALLSKMIPIIANGLKSPLASFHHASLMIICQLVVTVKLSPTIVQSVIKIILMKLKDSSLASTLSTLVVICQQQDVEYFSTKGVLKVLRKDRGLIWPSLFALASQTDLQPFLNAFWNTLMTIILDESQTATVKDAALSALLETSQSEMLYKKQAFAFLSKIIDFHKQVAVSSKFRKNVYTLSARYSDEFNMLCDEWRIRDEEFLNSFLEVYSLHNLLIIREKDTKKKRRSRNNSIRASTTEESKIERKTAVARADEMAQKSEFARRQKFGGDPIKKALEWCKENDWNNVSWALEEICGRKVYLKGQLDEDVEDFSLRMIRSLSKDPSGFPVDKLKVALSKVVFNDAFICLLLTRYEDSGTIAKKPRSATSHKKSGASVFIDETTEQFDRRLNFTLELLNISESVTVSGNTYKILFELVKELDVASDRKYSTMNHQLTLQLLIKLLNYPGKYKVTINDLQIDCIVDSMRNTQSHHILRESLSLLTACVRLNPASVTSHVMSVFTFMGSGLLRKDNELTLSIIEQTLEALFIAVLKGTGNKSSDAITFKLIDVTRIFATSACDIPAHRRARMARAICKAIGPANAWIVSSVMLEGLCTQWKRSCGDALKKVAEQDAFDDIALEICSYLEPVDQLSTVLDLIQFAIRLGGDHESAKVSSVDSSIFDRNKHSIPKLRHFRYVIIGVVVKILSNRNMYEKLSKVNDDSLYDSMVPIGKTLISTSVALDEFLAKESKLADSSKDESGVRYWTQLQTRAESVSEKLRHLLPGGVAARIVSDVLEDDSTECRLREKALQLTNIKLMHDGFFYTDSGINESHLIRLASVLNKWICPVRSSTEQVILCQNAAYSLKLVAKRIPRQSDSDVLGETMKKCADTISQWKTLDGNMVGNVLLLAGELIRSHNMRSTMLSSEDLLIRCLDILSECTESFPSQSAKTDTECISSRLQRVRQQSLSGRKLGSDSLLMCSLTCLQRILDQFAAFISGHLGEILVRFGRLSGRYCASEAISGSSIDFTANKSNVQHRLSLIREALSTFELRVLPPHFSFAVKQLAKEEKPLCAVFSLLSGFFKMPSRSVIVQLREELVTSVFLPALSYRVLERAPEMFENVCSVEQCVFDSLLRMVGVLTEVNLRSVVAAIVKWAEPALNASADYSVKVRLISLFHFANRFYSSFNSLALPYFGKIFELAPKVLQGCNLTTTIDIRTILLTGKKDTVEGLEADYLIKEVVDFVANCARHREFMTTERADSISTTVVDELVNTKLAGHESRCVPHLADAIYRISDAVSDSFGEILNNVLLKTRNNRPKIRFRTLLVVESLFEKVGDGIAPHLPMVMPFLSELLEDENKAVEEQCDRIIRLLQNKFGENIAEGFA